VKLKKFVGFKSEFGSSGMNRTQVNEGDYSAIDCGPRHAQVEPKRRPRDEKGSPTDHPQGVESEDEREFGGVNGTKSSHVMTLAFLLGQRHRHLDAGHTRDLHGGHLARLSAGVE
jgi:hypothetical protein